MVTFTVFTPVYNGQNTIQRVYNSLVQQDFTDFEWLVIDDGSTDDTPGVIRKMMKEATFKIRFFQQGNMHKFYSLLRGIELAEGEFFLVADADDEFRHDTLSRLYTAYKSLPANEQQELIGVNCLANDSSNRLVGDPYPFNNMISDHNEMRYKYKVKGEKWGMQKTEILKYFKFPVEYFNNGSIPEGILWSRVSDTGRKILFINETLRTYHNEKNRISISTGAKANLKLNSFGSMEALKYELNNQFKYFKLNPWHFVKSTVLYTEACTYQKLNPFRQAALLKGNAKIIYWMLFPLSKLFYLSRKSRHV